MMTPTMHRSAEISACGKYRYWLTRSWMDGTATLAFVMLNPSTADAEQDDPTIRRCIGFAKREGYGGIIVGNLYALRATDRKELRQHEDPSDPDNAAALARIGKFASRTQSPIVCAWGDIGDRNWRPAASNLRMYGAKLFCLGRTAKGHPRHPLYVPADQPLEPWP